MCVGRWTGERITPAMSVNVIFQQLKLFSKMANARTERLQLTVSVTVVEWDRLPEVPLTVTE